MKRQPGNWRFPFRRAQLHAQLRQPDQAVRDYSAALALAPGEPAVLVSRAEAYLELDQLDRAREDCEKVGRPERGDADLSSRLASVRAKVNDRVRSVFLRTARRDQPPFRVRVEVDHADRTYRDGEEVRLTITSEKDGYLYLLRCDPGNRVACVFPNKGQKDARIAAASPVTVPPKGTPGWRVGPPPGPQVFKALVTDAPLKGLALADLTREDATPLGTGQEAIDRLRALEGELTGRPGVWAEDAITIAAGTRTVAMPLRFLPTSLVW
jgi:hypothetical protein